MGIGVQALGLMRQMQDEGLLRGMTSVMELGSQTFAPDLSAARAALAALFPEMDVLAIKAPRDLYRALGFNRYVSIDLDGHDGALTHNLNHPLAETYGFRETFDFVTNHGTTEHAFDQFRCFENVHRLTRPGGIMLHALPSQGYQNHAFFNYHPSFFLDLASANGYEVLGLHYNIGEELFPYTDRFLADRAVAATDFVAVFATLRKTTGADFIVPFDGRYYMEERDGAFVPRTDVGSHGRVEENDFLLSSGPAYQPPAEAAERQPTTRFVLPVWGEAFTGGFLAFGLRAMIENGSLEAIPGGEAEFVIVTDRPGARRLEHAALVKRLKAIMPLRLVVAPALHGETNYARLTRHYNVALKDAVPGDRYVFLTSDCFFSAEVFGRVIERLRTHRVVLSPALRVVEESFLTHVLSTGSWKLSGRELLAFALRHEHPLTEAFCVDNPRDISHPLPAQVLARVEGGYVGRWTVMHPLAMRITNTLAPIEQTIDWNYGVLQVEGWSDVAVLDSIEDGLTVSTTPLRYHQGERYRRGSKPRQHVENLKNWVSIPWSLEYHLAQVTHPVRLLSKELPSGGVEAAEEKVEDIVSRFMGYVNSRRFLPRVSFHDLSAAALLGDAVDRRQVWREVPRIMDRAGLKLVARAKVRVKRYLGLGG